MAPLPTPPDSFSNYYSKWDSYAAGIGDEDDDSNMPGSIADQSRPVAEARQQLERQNQVSAQKVLLLESSSHHGDLTVYRFPLPNLRDRH